MFDPLVRVALGRHHHELPLDQLEILVLADDPGIDHALDIVDAERAAGKPFSGPGDSNIHVHDRIWLTDTLGLEFVGRKW
jgi:hypothetical protein